MTSLKHPTVRFMVIPILQIRPLTLRVVKSLSQGHTAWESGSQSKILHLLPQAPSPHPQGLPSSEEFLAEFPTPHHSVPGMVQPLFTR